MWHQNSFQNEEKGALYLVPTPIGNLEDITYRAIHILKMVDLIAAEDTRQTRKLLNHFDISTPLTSYHEHNKKESGSKLLAEIKQGKKVALVSDAGMPCISDPGYELVVSATEEMIDVIPLPGANAALPALAASGLPTEHFYFYGFLSRQKKDKKQELNNIKQIKDTLIFYESPHRLKGTLQLMAEILGNRKITLCRELTKKFEEFIRGHIEDAVKWANDETIRGEFCLIVEGIDEDSIVVESSWWEEYSIKDHVDYYIEHNRLRSKDAIKKVAEERQLPKRDVYQAYHIDD